MNFAYRKGEETDDWSIKHIFIVIIIIYWKDKIYWTEKLLIFENNL